jgi:hypothetical protein
MAPVTAALLVRLDSIPASYGNQLRMCAQYIAKVLFGDFDFAVYQNTPLELVAPFWICVYGFVL